MHMAELVTGKDKIIKILKFHLEDGIDSKRPRIVWDLQDTDYDRFEIDPDMLNDGSRFIVANNEDTILVGYYTVMSSFQLNKDYGFEVEKVIFEKMREILGFKRKF